MGKVMAVNISVKRGTQKVNVHTVKLIENYGLENDAHAGNWHRQVSLLSYEKIEEFKAKGAPVKDGAFGENLIVQGFDFKTLPVGTRLKCNDVILEITQMESSVTTAARFSRSWEIALCPAKVFLPE